MLQSTSKAMSAKAKQRPTRCMSLRRSAMLGGRLIAYVELLFVLPARSLVTKHGTCRFMFNRVCGMNDLVLADAEREAVNISLRAGSEPVCTV